MSIIFNISNMHFCSSQSYFYMIWWQSHDEMGVVFGQVRLDALLKQKRWIAGGAILKRKGKLAQKKRARWRTLKKAYLPSIPEVSQKSKRRKTFL
jgi:hypothetical protein